MPKTERAADFPAVKTAQAAHNRISGELRAVELELDAARIGIPVEQLTEALKLSERRPQLLGEQRAALAKVTDPKQRERLLSRQRQELAALDARHAQLLTPMKLSDRATIEHQAAQVVAGAAIASVPKPVDTRELARRRDILRAAEARARADLDAAYTAAGRTILESRAGEYRAILTELQLTARKLGTLADREHQFRSALEQEGATFGGISGGAAWARLQVDQSRVASYLSQLEAAIAQIDGIAAVVK